MLSLRKSILLSACLHVALFSTFFVLSGTGRARLIYKPQYQVRLVDASEVPSLQPRKKAKAPAQAPAKPPPPPSPPPPEKKKVSLPPKKEAKPVVAKKEPPKPKASPPGPKPETKAPPPPPPAPAEAVPEKALEDVLARLEKDLKDTKGKEATPSSGPGASGWAQRQQEIRYHQYYDEVERRVRENWIPPKTVESGRQDVLTVVSITLLSDGRVLESSIEESSGDPMFDQSVMRALMKSSPLPPPPLGGGGSRYELGLRFHSLPHAP